MSDQSGKPFNIYKSQGRNSAMSFNDKRSQGDFECRESELSIDSFADKKTFKAKKEEKQGQKMMLQNEQHNQGIQEQDYLKLYEQENFKYVNEGFSVMSNYYIKKIASDESASKIACKYPLYKMIRSIVKKFLFNELEIIFFAYILEENKWQIDDDQLKKSAFSLVDFLNITEVKEPLDYKNVLLYLVLNAYAVKYYLNEQHTLDMFKAHLETIIHKFKELFSYWSKKFASNSLKINPKQLNKVFKKLSQKPTECKQQQEDYNSLVDAIIQISPAYNNEKPDHKREPQQKIEATNGPTEGRSRKKIQQQQNTYQQQMIPMTDNQPQMFDQFFNISKNDSMQIPGLNNKQISAQSENNEIDTFLNNQKMQQGSNNQNLSLLFNNSFFGGNGQNLQNLDFMSSQYMNMNKESMMGQSNIVVPQKKKPIQQLQKVEQYNNQDATKEMAVEEEELPNLDLKKNIFGSSVFPND